jgi:hypothetical protein
MKPLPALALFLISAAAATAQTKTNTFPDSGNVGIGTTSPVYPLEVANTNSLSIAYQRTGVAAKKWGFLSDNYSTYWCNLTDSVLALTLSNSGNVGIGTTNPTSKLDVVGGVSSTLSDSSSYSLLQARNDIGAVLQTITFGSAKTGTTFGLANANLAAIYSTAAISQGHTALAVGTYGNAPLAFGTNGMERVRVDQSGNVGIGTTSPTTPLDVVTDRPYGLRVFRAVANSGLQVGADNAGAVLSSEGIHVIRFYTNGEERLQLNASGNVGIGTTSPTEKLSVNGRIRAKEVIVETTGWSDSVFAKDYKLASLSEVEQQIQQSGHLAGVPSATEVAEKGISVGDMQAVLLAKIEELTLHQIAQEKRLAAQDAKIEAQTAEIVRLKTATP